MNNNQPVNVRGFKKKESTAKKIAKIIFVAVGVIFTFLAYVIAYNTGASSKYQDDINAAVKKNDYNEVARLVCYSGPYDTNSYVNNDNDKNNIKIYGTIAAESEKYYAKDNDTTKTVVFQEVEYFYYYCVYNPNFSYGTIDGKNTNETGIKFYNETLDKSYTYHFIVDQNNHINEAEYNAYPEKPEETVLSIGRNVLKQLDSYGFICLPMSNLFIDAVSEKIGGTISRVELVNNKGEAVSGTTFDLKLDFSQDFFKDLAEYKENAYIAYDLGQKSGKSDEEKEKEENANKYLNEFVLSDELKNKGYAFSAYRDEIYSASLIWSSVGIAALFLLSVAIIFVLVFYFVPIKNWIFGGRHSRTTQRIVPNKRPINPTPSQKTSFDRVNEKRAEDLAKKRAKEEEIRRNGNMIIAPKAKDEAKEDVSEVKNEDVVDAEIVEANDTKIVESSENTESLNDSKEETTNE